MTYQRFAHVYDRLMTDIPYADYVEWIKGSAPVQSHPQLLDIGCGTGTLSLLFHEAGYQVTGTDLSEEMLSVAQERFMAAKADIPLVAQSMHELEGFSGFDIAVIAIDSLNYLQEQEDVEATFKHVYEALRTGGYLFFDVHSVYKADHLFLDGPFVYDHEELSYIWFTEEGEDPHSVYHDLTFFIKQPNGLFERFEESHYQRTFPFSTYVQWLKEAGFSEVTVTADWANTAPGPTSERIFIHALK
jgi:SAM-dependent methyltransferase